MFTVNKIDSNRYSVGIYNHTDNIIFEVIGDRIYPTNWESNPLASTEKLNANRANEIVFFPEFLDSDYVFYSFIQEYLKRDNGRLKTVDLCILLEVKLTQLGLSWTREGQPSMADRATGSCYYYSYSDTSGVKRGEMKMDNLMTICSIYLRAKEMAKNSSTYNYLDIDDYLTGPICVFGHETVCLFQMVLEYYLG